MIIALDLATKTGVALGDPGTIPICFTEVLGDAGDHHGARMAQALRMMSRLIEKYQPHLIVLEAPIGVHGGGSKRRPEVLMGLRGCVMGVAHMRNIPFEQHEVSTIRKHFLGVGNLKRVDAKRATVKRCGMLGWTVHNDDEADACALWDLACARRSRSHSIATTPLFGKEASNGPRAAK